MVMRPAVTFDADQKQLARERMLTRWQDPRYKRRHTEINRRRSQDPQVKAKISRASQQRWNDPAQRQRILALRQQKTQQNLRYLQQMWSDPKRRARLATSLRKERQQRRTQGTDWNRVKWIYYTPLSGWMRMEDAVRLLGLKKQCIRFRCAYTRICTNPRRLRYQEWKRAEFHNTAEQIRNLKRSYRSCFGKDLPYVDPQKKAV